MTRFWLGILTPPMTASARDKYQWARGLYWKLGDFAKTILRPCQCAPSLRLYWGSWSILVQPFCSVNVCAARRSSLYTGVTERRWLAALLCRGAFTVCAFGGQQGSTGVVPQALKAIRIVVWTAWLVLWPFLWSTWYFVLRWATSFWVVRLLMPVCSAVLRIMSQAWQSAFL